MLQTVQSEYGGLHGDGEGFVLTRLPFFDVEHQLVEEVEVQASNAVAMVVISIMWVLLFHHCYE